MPGALGRVVLVLLFLTCIPPNPKIIEGRYPAAIEPVYSPSSDDPVVRQLRSTIETASDSLNRNDSVANLARRFFPIEAGVKFSFSYPATVDTRYLLLRYFGPIPKPDRYAGYSIQFLYDRHGRRLIKIFVERVPLE